MVLFIRMALLSAIAAVAVAAGGFVSGSTLLIHCCLIHSQAGARTFSTERTTE
jgi:hypothetical protein